MGNRLLRFLRSSKTSSFATSSLPHVDLIVPKGAELRTESWRRRRNNEGKRTKCGRRKGRSGTQFILILTLTTFSGSLRNDASSSSAASSSPSESDSSSDSGTDSGSETSGSGSSSSYSSRSRDRDDKRRRPRARSLSSRSHGSERERSRSPRR